MNQHPAIDSVGESLFSFDSTATSVLAELLRRQTDSALGAACINHFTSAKCCHAGTKAVGANTLKRTGLKSSFHDWFPIYLLGIQVISTACAVEKNPIKKARRIL